MNNKIAEIIKNTDWDIVAVSLKDNDNIIYQAFTTQYDLAQFIEQNLTKYEVRMIDHSLVLNQKTGKTTLNLNFAFDSQNKTLNDIYIRKLGEDIMIELNVDEIEDVKRVESTLREKFLKVLTINTEDVKALYYPFEQEHTYLRADTELHTLPQTAVLHNAPTVEGDYVTIIKVVK